MARPAHPDKDIEDAVTYAEGKGWRYEKPGKSAHPWGKLFCPSGLRNDCPMLLVWSTPRDRYYVACATSRSWPARSPVTI